MMQGKESIFRRNSLKKVSSPEQLNDYIKVVKPSTWLILVGILILLAAAVIWSVFGKLETKVTGHAVEYDGTWYCTAAAKEAQKIKKGQVVRSGERKGKVKSVSQKPMSYEEISSVFGNDEYLMYALEVSKEDWSYLIEIEGISGENGEMEIQIVTDVVNPIYFIVN